MQSLKTALCSSYSDWQWYLLSSLIQARRKTSRQLYVERAGEGKVLVHAGCAFCVPACLAVLIAPRVSWWCEAPSSCLQASSMTPLLLVQFTFCGSSVLKVRGPQRTSFLGYIYSTEQSRGENFPHLGCGGASRVSCMAVLLAQGLLPRDSSLLTCSPQSPWLSCFGAAVFAQLSTPVHMDSPAQEPPSCASLLKVVTPLVGLVKAKI